MANPGGGEIQAFSFLLPPPPFASLFLGGGSVSLENRRRPPCRLGSDHKSASSSGGILVRLRKICHILSLNTCCP